MKAEVFLQKQTKKIYKNLKEKYGIDYLDICFVGERIMISNAEDIKITSGDGGENWQKR